MNTNYKHFVFDLYGTLIDLHTDEQCAKTWKKWCKWLDAHNVKHPEYFRFRKDFFDLDREHRVAVKERLGCSYPEIDIVNVYRELFLRYGNKPFDDDFLNGAAYAFRVASRDYIKLFPGVTEYLEKIAANGGQAYILSNAQRAYTWPEIEMFGLDKITKDQFISSDYGYMKPEKFFFDVLIEKYDMDRDEVLMHGDSYASDCVGAMNAGIDYVHLVGENHPSRYWGRSRCARHEDAPNATVMCTLA